MQIQSEPVKLLPRNVVGSLSQTCWNDMLFYLFKAGMRLENVLSPPALRAICAPQLRRGLKEDETGSEPQTHCFGMEAGKVIRKKQRKECRARVLLASLDTSRTSQRCF